MKNINIFAKETSSKEVIISIISLLYFCVVVFYIFMDGFGKKGSSGVSGFIEQDNLRKSLGDWYQLIFYTFQVNIYFLIIGISYVFLHNNKVVKNLFFCSSSLLLFCFFSMTVFNFNSFKTNAYEASKTLFVHCLIPLSSFFMVLSIRNEIFLEYKWLWINSLYILFYVVLTIIIYYTFTFSQDSQYPGKPLWIYKFLNYDYEIMFVPLPNLSLTILGIIVTLLISAPIGMLLFVFMKFCFLIRIEPFKPKKINREL